MSGPEEVEAFEFRCPGCGAVELTRMTITEAVTLISDHVRMKGHEAASLWAPVVIQAQVWPRPALDPAFQVGTPR